MGLLPLLIVALAASAAYADDCACVKQDQIYDQIDNPMVFFQQPTIGGVENGVSCSMDCKYTVKMSKDDPEYSFQVQILTNKIGDGTIIFTGLNGDFKMTTNTQPGILPLNSIGDSLTLDFTESATNNGQFVIVISRVKGRPAAPVFTTAPTAAPTPPYDHVKYDNNPLLVANDIMIGVDISSAGIESRKQFAMDLINALTITNATDCGVGTRIGLHGVTNYLDFTATYLPDWTFTSETAIGNIQSMSQQGNGPFYITPLKAFVDAGFKDNTNKQATDPDRCPNRGRMYILLTANQPAEFNPSTNKTSDDSDAMIQFLEKGVHPIVVSPLQGAQLAYYNLYEEGYRDNDKLNRWATFNIDDGVTKFINKYLVATCDELTCQPAKADLTVTLSADTKEGINPGTVSIPAYYEGRTTDAASNWETIKHYCNFQSTVVNIVQNKDSKPTETDVCVKVFYDLETGKDFVSIFSIDPVTSVSTEVVRLTGRDVSGTTFNLGSIQGSIVFSSDEKNVYDGFYAEIYPC